MTDKYIYMTSNKKIMNPLYSSDKSDILSYHGEIDKIDFEYQETNYILLSKSLEPFNIKFNKIWYGKFTNSVNKIKTQFVAKTEDDSIYWQKYEGMAPGGCQNRLFIYGKEYKTTQWLKLSHLERQNIINQN